MLKQLSVVFGDHMKLKNQLRNFSQSVEMMVLIWTADGLKSWRSHTEEVVSRWFHISFGVMHNISLYNMQNMSSFNKYISSSYQNCRTTFLRHICMFVS